MRSAVEEDTDRHAAIYVKHLSPTFVRWLDRELGRTKVRNGGYAELQVRFEHSQTGMVRWLTSLLPSQWRHDIEESE
jgi:hypothetical protein